jgi:predicted transcriptional regulator
MQSLGERNRIACPCKDITTLPRGNARAGYHRNMADTILDLNQSIPSIEEEDEETLAAIDRGIEAADEGRTVPSDEVRKMIPEWISKFDTRNRR